MAGQRQGESLNRSGQPWGPPLLKEEVEESDMEERILPLDDSTTKVFQVNVNNEDLIPATKESLSDNSDIIKQVKTTEALDLLKCVLSPPTGEIGTSGIYSSFGALPDLVQTTTSSWIMTKPRQQNTQHSKTLYRTPRHTPNLPHNEDSNIKACENHRKNTLTSHGVVCDSRKIRKTSFRIKSESANIKPCLLYTSDAADE